MRALAFASRNEKEILRDPLTLVFGCGLPIVLMLLINMLQKNIPGANNAFMLENFAPGMVIFSFSFISLFAGLLLANDRSSSFLLRVFASPLRGSDYIIGYALPLLPLALIQAVLCFAAAALLGLTIDWHIIIVLLVLLPASFLFISLGLLFGALCNEKQLGGIFTIFVNVATWLSGTWFDLNLIGGAFKSIGYALPFAHAVDVTRAALQGDFAAIFPALWWVIGYAFICFVLAVFVFRRRMHA